MSKKMSVKVKLFGSFRSYGEFLEVSLQDSSTIKDLKIAMKDMIEEQDLPVLESSAFSDDKMVLDEGFVLNNLDEVAILPPVCGG